MPTRLKDYLAVAAVAVALVGALIIAFGIFPRSVLGWLALLIVGIPAWVVLEWSGEAASRMPFFQRLSSPTRILIGIPFGIAFIVMALLVALFLQNIVLAL